MFTRYIEIHRSDLRICRLFSSLLQCLQHSSRTLLYNTCCNASLQHFSAIFFPNSSSILLYNNALQHSSVTLLYNTLLQHFSTTLFSNTSLQHFSPKIFSNTSYLFPTCQVRVVRFYVSCVPPPTAIVRIQCSVPDLNRDPVSPAFRAAPLCVRVPRRTSTAIL